MEYPHFSAQIINLKNKDLEFREKLIADKKLGEGYNTEMEKMHNQNASFLNEIIEKIGYPTIDKVGSEAGEAAWLIIQHSISQPEFMKKCLKLLETAVSENKAAEINLAYLSDRIAVFENKPQLYGTQFDWDENGFLSPNFYDNLDKVNQRRKRIGLNTIEDQTEIMRKRAQNENQLPPKDFEKRKLEVEEWKKRAGWLI